jgi:hypothetical protein
MQRTHAAKKEQTSNKGFNCLCAEFLDVALLALEGERDDTGNVHLGAVDVHVQTELDTNRLDVLQTLLVVGAGTADPDLDLVLDEDGGDLADGADQTLEGAGHVGEVGNTTTDEENLALGVHGSTEHKVQDSAGVLEGLGLTGGTGVLSVVSELAHETSGSNGIGVDDGGTTTSNEGPDATLGVENGKLEGSTGLGVHVGDELLLLGHLTTEGSGEIHRGASVDVDLAIGGSGGGHAESSGAAGNSPLGAALELSGLVNLGCQIEEVNIGGGGVSVRDDDQGVDLEVGELAVNVDSVQASDEVDEDIVNTLGDLAQQASGDLLVGGVLLEVDGNQQLLSLGIDITDINTTLVVEENPVTLKLYH